MNLKLKVTLAIGMLALAFAACTSTPGPAGPAGPSGPTGTANVIYSAWKFAAADWNNITIDSAVMKTSFILAPEVTQAILDSGDVRVYLRLTGVLTPTPFPYTGYAGGAVSTMSAVPKLETTEPVGYIPVPAAPAVAASAAVATAKQARIRLFRFTHDNTNSVGVSSSLEYRYIIIPGGIAAAGAGKVQPDWKNYESVKRFYNIPD